jgi:uncharacterized protein YndB with AHSA1/START domain
MTMQATETDAIRKSVTVPLPIDKAFRLFTDGVNTWWPFASHSIGGEQVEEVIFDVDAKRLYERDADGSEHDWGDIHVWDPPNRFLLGWRVNPASPATEVEVRFSREGEETRVDLEHRGWERCGPAERSSYDSGWGYVLGKYEAEARG